MPNKFSCKSTVYSNPEDLFLQIVKLKLGLHSNLNIITG